MINWRLAICHQEKMNRLKFVVTVIPLILYVRICMINERSANFWCESGCRDN